jgi:hypothetical protein
MESIVVKAEYDDEARVWVASNDQLGLATEAETIDVLTYKLQQMIPELVTLNKIDLPRPIRFTLVSERHALAFA